MIQCATLDIRYVCAICFLLLSPSPAYPQSQEPIQAPRVQTEEQTNGSTEPEAYTEKQTDHTGSLSPTRAQQTPSNTQRNGNTNSSQSTQEASEYWSILGRRVKITDTLVAAFTFLLFIATIGLIVVGTLQSRQLKSTVDLAIEDLISTHRPRLRVRRCFPVRKSDGPAVEYVIANYGDTAATIVEMSTSLWDNQSGGGALRWNPSPSYAPSVPVSARIESGAAITKIHDKNAKEFFTAVEARAAPEPIHSPTIGSDLLFLGYIVYEDGIGRKRTTAFCRAYKRSTKRFIPIEDEDYEYQD